MSTARGRLVRGSVVAAGLLAVFAAASEAAVDFWWVAALGAAGAAAAAWRHTRWLAVLTPLSVLVLSAGVSTAATAVLAGALVVGFLLLTDLAETLDLPDLASTVPGDVPANVSEPSAGAGWATWAGELWLVGVFAAVVVAAVASTRVTPVAGVVAVAPVLAIGAAYLAFGRQRS